MEKSYKNIVFFFIFILAFVIWGFFRTYFGLFPSFEGITTVQHFHGLMLLSWFAMLIVQPLLIHYNKPVWHKNLGKISYLQIPLLLFSIFLVSRGQFLRNATTIPREQNIGGLALDLPDIFAFATFYILAMVNKKNTAYHMRYMIATSLLMLGPGTGRAFIIYGGIPFPQAIEYSTILTEIITLALIIYDVVKKNPYKPYVVALVVLAFMHLTWEFQLSNWWQAFGGKFAEWFF